MQVQLARWGNSLGLRIPKELAGRVGLTEGSRVTVEAESNRLVISAERPHYRLEELLQGMKPGDLQEAFDWGPDIGREVIDDER